ncbi:MAG: NERD domain-containing protein [Deferribacterales bacterium]
MIKMIPQRMDPHCSSKAEKKLFQKFAEDDSLLCTIIHSLALAKHETKRKAEIDFLIISKFGIFVIEVKGGGVKREDGKWFTVDAEGDEYPLKESPYEQASTAMFAVIDYLKDKLGFHHDITRTVFGYGVFFPDINELEFGIESSEKITFTRKNMTDDLSRIISSIYQFAKRENTKYFEMNDESIDKVVKCLIGNFIYIPKLNETFQNIGEEQEILLNREQTVALNTIENFDFVTLIGGAGTGKTLIAIETAKRLNGNTLFICFNKNLASHIAEHLQLHSNVTVRNIHGLIEDIVSDSIYYEEYKESLSANLEFLYHKDYYTLAAMVAIEKNLKWENIIVDEGQDILIDGVLDFIDTCIVGGLARGKILWCMDFHNQASVFNRFDESQLDKLMKLSVTQVLNINCRNTKHINKFVEEFTKPSRKSLCYTEGLPVNPITYSSPQDEEKKVIKIFDELISKGIGKSVMLFPKVNSNCFQRLVESAVIGNVSGKYFYKKLELVPSSVAAFKGLESEVIILTGVERLDSDWWRSTLYVAITRAKYLLYILIDNSLEKERIEGVIWQ